MKISLELSHRKDGRCKSEGTRPGILTLSRFGQKRKILDIDGYDKPATARKDGRFLNSEDIYEI